MTVYTNPNILYSSGIWSYNGFLVRDPAMVPSLKPTVDARANTLVADLLSLFKQHARIDHNLDDALCSLYLSAAISRAEQYCMLPILPKAYTWDMPSGLAGYDAYELPLRNASVVGGTTDAFPAFEPLLAHAVYRNATWPATIQVGFSAGSQMPSDMTLAVFELALALYEYRDNPAMANVYAPEIMAGNLQRYYVPRV